MKKLLIIVLLFSFLAQAASCGNNTETDTGSSSETSSGTTAAPETDYLDQYKDKDFGGETLNIIAQHTTASPSVPPEEQTGEVVDDAIYYRDQAVEELLNIDINYIVFEDRGKLKSSVQTAINAGEAIYDVIITSMADGLNTLAPEGYLLDLETLPSLSLSEAWWSKSCNNNLSFYGKQYITSGPISLTYYYAPCIIAFNQRLCDEYKIPDLYQTVIDGKWTIDKFAEITKNIAQDLDNDGNMGKEDFYAFACDELTGQAFYIGCGGTQTEAGGNGDPTLSMGSAKNTDILDKIISVVSNDGRLLTESVLMENSNIPAFNKTWHFKNSQSMLLGYNMSGIITYMRDMKDDYGIIPMPKYNENQEDYLTYGSPWGPCGVSVPVTLQAEKTEMAGSAMETLAYISYTTVGTQMYNVTLKEKVSRDENSKLMLDMIYEDIIFDLNGIHNFGNTGKTLRSCAIGAAENFTSSYASALPKAESDLEKLVGQYKEIAE